MAAWWIMPAVAGAAALYAKWKQAAGMRWFLGTEDEAKKSPVALLLARLHTGIQLPAPSAGFQWKAVKFLMAMTPLAAPQEIDVNVLEPVTAKSGTSGLGAVPVAIEEIPVRTARSGDFLLMWDGSLCRVLDPIPGGFEFEAVVVDGPNVGLHGQYGFDVPRRAFRAKAEVGHILSPRRAEEVLYG